MATVVIGAGDITAADVAAVAYLFAPVAIEGAALEKLKTHKRREDDLSIACSNEANNERKLDCSQSRAVIFAAANYLLQDKTGASVESVQFLVECLNAKITPCLSANDTAVELAQFLRGNGRVMTPNSNNLAEASVVLTECGVSACTPTLADIRAITGASCAAAALTSLVARGLQLSAVTADCVTAFSFEALKANVTVLDPEYVDSSHCHAASVESATAIRLLLEDSTECTRSDPKDKSKGYNGVFEALSIAHELHGTAHAAAATFTKAAHSELKSAPIGFMRGSGVHAAHHVQPLLDELVRVGRALQALRKTSIERLKILSGSSLKVPECPVLDFSELSPMLSRAQSHEAATNAALALLEALDVQQGLYCQELLASDSMLAQREAAAVEHQKRKELARRKIQEEQAQKEQESAKKRAAEIAALPESERAKAEEKERKAAEKRAAKAAKAAEKAAKKAGKSSSGQGALLGLGKGTRALRSWIQSSAAEVDPSRLETDEMGFPTIVALQGEFMHNILAFEKQFHLESLPLRTLSLLGEITSGGSHRKPKIAKGTRDFAPEQMEVRETVFTTIKDVFRRHGAVQIDTPVFELRETLLGKYGDEGGKLIYDLADQGGEALSLRYDLTVPFARYVAMNKLPQLKRYHISKVYRRDQPNISRGRYREFYQCDFDVAGASFAPMLPDAEVIKVACEILDSLPIGTFQIKLNHRLFLDGMLEIAGVPSKKFRTICSSIDKLDKESWDDVRHEMVVDKGLSPEIADKIGKMVSQAGEPFALLEQLKRSDSFCVGHSGSQQALSDLEKLFTYLQAMNALQFVSFDLSLARGLDYYTGVIYEAVLTDPSVAVGSIAAGGRYDNLVGMFSSTGEKIPCVGVSIGVERVFAIMEANANKAGGLKKRPVDVLIASAGKESYLTSERLKLCSDLWAAGISAETLYVDAPNMKKQLDKALSDNIPYMIVIGETEVRDNVIKLKIIEASEERTVQRNDLVTELKSLIGSSTPSM